MRYLITISLSLLMTLTLAGCPENPFGGDDGGKSAKAPPAKEDRGGCKYDWSEQRYRYENGDNCNYDEWYDEDACYNYYYDVRWDRYYNENGDPVNCNNDYIDGNNVIPYYNYNYWGGYTYSGCPGGYYQVPVGFGYYVCSVSPQSNNSLNLNWWFWLNL